MADIERINTYWSKRAEEFSAVRLQMLAGPSRLTWEAFLKENLPCKEGKIRALDTGTGAGFYAFMLAELGCEVTAIDYSDDMIAEAKKLASQLHYPPVNFLQMDAQNMTFPDESFDFIFSNNVTWTVPEPEKVYAEWYRLLAPGGVVVNLDANYGYVFKVADESGWTEKMNKKYEEEGQTSIGSRPDMIIERNSITRELSITKEHRPQWDLDRMYRLGFGSVYAEANINARLFPEMMKHMPDAGILHKDENAPDTRIFMVKGVK